MSYYCKLFKRQNQPRLEQKSKVYNSTASLDLPSLGHSKPQLGSEIANIKMHTFGYALVQIDAQALIG